MTSISSKDDVLTLLVHLGYLAYEADTKSVYIPNEEIRQEFIRAVKYGRHREIAELVVASDRLLQDTLRMDSERVAEGYGSDILLVGISYDEKTKRHECLIEKYGQ